MSTQINKKESDPKDIFAGLPQLDAASMIPWQGVLDGLSEPFKTVYLLSRVYQLTPAEISQRMRIPSPRTRKLISIAMNSANRAAETKKIKDAHCALESLESFLSSSDLEAYHHIASLIRPIKCSLLEITASVPLTEEMLYSDEKFLMLYQKLQEMLEVGDAHFICKAINLLHTGILHSLSEEANKKRSGLGKLDSAISDNLDF